MRVGFRLENSILPHPKWGGRLDRYSGRAEGGGAFCRNIGLPVSPRLRASREEEESHAGRLSPDYTDEEAPHIFDGNDFSEERLLPFAMTVDFSRVTRLHCPVIMLEGRHDMTTNADLAYAWFQKLAAPDKRFVWFENSAHEPESEEPGKFLLSLVHYALPHAGGSADNRPPASAPTTRR